jgi:WD40 repeat protein
MYVPDLYPGPAHWYMDHSGGSALFFKSGQYFLLLHNVRGSLDVLALNTSKQRTLKFPQASSSQYACSVAFLHGGNAVVSGTNSGDICIWNIKSGEFFQILSHKG